MVKVVLEGPLLLVPSMVDFPPLDSKILRIQHFYRHQQERCYYRTGCIEDSGL